jgi:hypothetical protein
MIRLLSVTALAALATVIAIEHGAVRAQESPTNLLQPISRPFPIVQVQIGDVPVALPQDRVEAKIIDVLPGNSKTISFVNANLRRAPRSAHFEVPLLRHFRVSEPAPGLPEKIYARSGLNWSKAHLTVRQTKMGFGAGRTQFMCWPILLMSALSSSR